MPRFIAFLRAINVGGHVVKMARLRLLFESLGVAHVETFIASGNVIFESGARNPSKLEAKIETLLQREFGYAVKTFLRTDAELARVAGYESFARGEEGTLFVGFMATEPTAEAQAKLLAAQTEVDAFHVSGRELYWRCGVRASDSLFSGARLEKTLGLPITVRNINTVRRLVAKYPPRP